MNGSSPCGACRKRCCTQYTVSINGYDAWVIGRGLHLPLESFLVYFPVTEQNERGFLLEPEGSRYEIALDKVGQYQKENPCVFWVELENGGGRCGIYAYRPMVCQTYPAYQRQDMVVLRDDVLCPEGAWNLVGMDLPVFRRRLSRFRMEQDIYAYVVAGWNTAVGREGRTFDIREYYAALMSIYESLNRWVECALADVHDHVARNWGEMDPTAPNPLFADIVSQDEDEQWHAAVTGIRECIGRATPWSTGSREVIAAVA